MNFWNGKRILVTGGAGFIGTHIVENLVTCRGVPRNHISVPRSALCDLRQPEAARSAVEGCDIVIHLAAVTGGIAFSRAHPASQYHDSMLMNLNVMRAAAEARVAKFVGICSILVYPESSPSPLVESYLHNGRVATTHIGIGTAKRDQILMSEMYHLEYGLNAVNVSAANAYGPGDRFDPGVSHVIPATIIKCHEQNELVVWGDGSPTRDFLYIEDLVEGLLLAAERLDAPDYYVNISSGHEISIKDLVNLIARLSGFSGSISFDASKGGGDPSRCASGERARERFGFLPRVSMEEGLSRVIAWYRENVRGKSHYA